MLGRHTNRALPHSHLVERNIASSGNFVGAQVIRTLLDLRV
jgi:hypothetical protein